MNTPTRSQLQHIGSLITYHTGTGETCLGSLMHFAGHGVYDPKFGRVDVTPEEANAHNKALDLAMIEGMDVNCQVGQGAYAYYVSGRVSTFNGTLIADAPQVRITGETAHTITFNRKGKVYRGRLSEEGEAFNFRRVK